MKYFHVATHAEVLGQNVVGQILAYLILRAIMPNLTNRQELGHAQIGKFSLGVRSVDQGQARAAKAEAFLTVPLYKAVYEKYKGAVLPPPVALERDLVSLGVAEKVKAKARQVLASSAEQTGFHEQGKNKLVMPAVVTPPPGQAQKTGSGGGDGNGKGGGTGEENDLGLDPLLMALLQKIPKPGQLWPTPQRLRWFKTFAMNVSQVYDEEDNPVDLTITLSASNANQNTPS